jgi:hypothetical protein
VEPPLKKFVPDNANLKVLESYGKVLDDDYWGVWEKNEYKKEKGSVIDHRKGGELASKLDMEEKSKVRLSRTCWRTEPTSCPASP